MFIFQLVAMWHKCVVDLAMCGALRDLVVFVQFEKREKYP